MVSTPSAPVVQDPNVTAQKQGEMNKDTAIAQSNLNSVNQVTPQGSLTYTITGYNPDGTPIRTATTSLSPQEQSIYNLGAQTRQNIGQIGVDQSARIGTLLGTPVNLNNDAVESRLMQLGRSRLDPVLQQNRAATENDLINRGITPGTEAYDRAMKAVGQQENDAYNQLMLTGRGESINEILTERNQPINEISALLSGSAVSQPNFINTPSTAIAPTDYTGAVNSYNQANMAKYQSDQQANGAMWGGLAGLGGSLLGGWAKGGFTMPKFGG